ncbi:MAG: Stp1/IreP family PP2C-type Ser/Thr phosphatase [Clostridia bacterium]|nr:Stp1/IreP family PP2C-type Ser/Thr phosphatase [Clostridia bacterium]MBN2883397.1 Stp1/IreP family PP2C-type Ser/Thr phosphatase [Clostridia bacterium]
MQIRYGTGTSTGRVREQNEDSFTVIDCREKDFIVFAVADGMGGMDYGDLASATAIKILEDMGRGCDGFGKTINEVRESFRLLFSKINIEIINKSNDRESVAGMGTTMSLCCVDGNWINIGHIGDSRIYIMREGQIKQLTKDHSYVENLVDTGRITREQAKTHPDKNIITKALGLDMEVDSDYCREKLESGDRILLCSDGLTNELDDSEILKIIEDEKEPGEAVESLLAKANESGGRDNVTALLVFID